MSKLGDYLKENGLNVLGKAVKIGVGFAAGGPPGAIAAAASALGLSSNSDEEAVLAAAKADPMALVKLRELENAIPLATIEADTKRLEAELFTERTFYEQSQESYRTELNSTDDYVRRTRPLIVRNVFYLAVAMIALLAIGGALDYFEKQKFIDRCLKSKDDTECSELQNRQSYLNSISKAYADNWPWISLLIGILPGYFGSRGFEKLRNKDNTESENIHKETEV